jgi:charged multivesicular body protein 6
MLAGHLTNQDEDEVEDELEALQRELFGPEVMTDPVVLPSPPITDLPVEEPMVESTQTDKAKAETRTALPA